VIVATISTAVANALRVELIVSGVVANNESGNEQTNAASRHSIIRYGL